MRRVATWFLAFVALFWGVGHAQVASIAAPPDRFVAPGAYATLVFRVEATAAVEVAVTIDVDAGWTVLRPPGTMALEAGRATPIAVTIEVPSDAVAGAKAMVRIVVDGPDATVERTVALTATERVDVGLQAPAEHTLGGDALEVVVTNAGNVVELALLELRRDDVLLDRRTFALAPGAREIASFTPSEEGLHALLLTTERGTELRRGVRVLLYGTGLDVPFTLRGEVSAAIGSSGSGALAFGVEGAISDFVTVDARIEAAAWGRSFALAAGEAWTVRAGAGWRDPFGLALPADAGLGAWWQGEAWGVAAHAGWLGDDRYGGALSVEWSSGATEVAAGAGVRAGSPTLVLRAEAEPHPGTELLATAGLRAGVVDAALQLDVDEVPSSRRSRFTVGGRDLTGAASRVELGVRHRVAEAELYADGTLPVGSSATWSGRIGVREVASTPFASAVEVAVQVGTVESFGRVGYRSGIGAGWRVGAAGGVRTDALGFGVTFDASVVRTGANPVDLDARFVYRPETGRVGGRVGAQARFVTEPADVALAFGWDLTEHDLALGAVVGWTSGAWVVEADATVGLGYGTADAGRWRADVAFGGAYAFDLPVPESLVVAAGGRRSGVLEGRATTDADEPIAGVVLSVGRFRTMTDAAGAYHLELVPGRYDVAVDVSTVPIAYRLVAATRATVEVGLRETTTFDVPVMRTTVLRGRLLEDREGDGLADDPARPVFARVRVTDADGLVRVAVVDAAGVFELRGLPAGPARVEVFDLPLGASVVGEVPTQVDLVPGVASEVSILVRPVPARVAAFGGGALRIRSVVAEVDRAAPGSAPLVRVEVVGDAEDVAFQIGDRRVSLEPDDAGWIGRVPVPATIGAGVLPFVVEARAGEQVVERRAQLVVDPEAPLLEASADGPVRAGEALRVAVSAYFDAMSVRIDGPFGTLALEEVDPGRWAAVLTVPADAPDAVVELAVAAQLRGGGVATATVRFRVLAP